MLPPTWVNNVPVKTVALLLKVTVYIPGASLVQTGVNNPILLTKGV